MLKRLAKKLIKEQPWLFMSWMHGHFGFIQAVSGYINLLRNNGIATVPIAVCGGHVFLRPGTSDQDVYDQIFAARDYELELGNPRFIVDTGVHIGLSSFSSLANIRMP